MQNSTSNVINPSTRIMQIFGWTALISGGLSLAWALQMLFINPHAFAGDQIISAIIAKAYYTRNSATAINDVIVSRNGFPWWVFTVPQIVWACMSTKAGIDLLAMRKRSIRTYIIALGTLIAVNMVMFHAVDFLGIAYTYTVYHYLWKPYRNTRKTEEQVAVS
jgi:uncharacterized membrane protein